jgi:5-formyltetrahydrofolate cyclo-ligase
MEKDKQRLREKYKAIRLLTSPRNVEEDSIMICRRAFREVDWDKIRKVCAYDPIAELKEVDIKPLLETINYKYPDIKIRVLKQSKKQAVSKTKFDLILVPCLAFDKNNHRLGWGGGFYDKFLAGQPQALKIGLSYQSGLVRKGLPIESHDVQLDMIVTEDGVHSS